MKGCPSLDFEQGMTFFLSTRGENGVCCGLVVTVHQLPYHTDRIEKQGIFLVEVMRAC